MAACRARGIAGWCVVVSVQVDVDQGVVKLVLNDVVCLTLDGRTAYRVSEALGDAAWIATHDVSDPVSLDGA